MAGVAPAMAAADDAAMVQELHTQLSWAFALPKELRLDPGLRTAATAIARDHVKRIKAQLPAWIQEERSAQLREGGAASADDVYFAVNARVLNELAHWHIEPGDADYEKATLDAILASPTVCRTGDMSNFIDFSSRVLRIQAMPPAQQQAALATESRLLERWGKPRQPAPSWPHPLPQDAAAETIGRIREGGRRPVVALPPALAWRALSERTPFLNMHREVKCLYQRWWLQESLAQGRSAAAALNAFRYGTLVTAADRYSKEDETRLDSAKAEPVDDKPAYPKFALRYRVAGRTTVERRLDAAGRPAAASVVAREIAVRGIRGPRPIAFEDMFDAASVQHGLRAAAPGTPGSAPRFEMVWSLPPEQADGDDTDQEDE